MRIRFSLRGLVDLPVGFVFPGGLFDSQRDIGQFQQSAAVRRSTEPIVPGPLSRRALQIIARRYPKLAVSYFWLSVAGLLSHLERSSAWEKG